MAKSEQEYLEMARAFVGRQGILHHVRKSDGAIAFFDPTTGEFAVVAADGQTLLTYFRPDYQDGQQNMQLAHQYWQEQCTKRGDCK